MPAARCDRCRLAIAIEWPDLDPRLGYRSLGGWGPAEERDIVAQVRYRSSASRAGVERGDGIPVAISTPTLPPAPAFHTAGWEAGACELELEQAVAALRHPL